MLDWQWNLDGAKAAGQKFDEIHEDTDLPLRQLAESTGA